MFLFYPAGYVCIIVPRRPHIIVMSKIKKRKSISQKPDILFKTLPRLIIHRL